MRKTTLHLFLIFLFSSCLITLQALAHVGSPGVVMQRSAGPYRVLIHITPPDVVPGTAQVSVWVEQGRVRTCTVRPIYFDSGDEASPTHDELSPTDQQLTRFDGIVWLMGLGATSVELQLSGPDGSAKIEVPVMSIATAQRDMPVITALPLVLLGTFLFVLMVTIVGICVTQTRLKVGQQLPTSWQRSRWMAMGLSSVLLLILLTGGRFWWNSRARFYSDIVLYKAPKIHPSVRSSELGNQLTITIDSTSIKQQSRPLSFLVPDHGKLMHVFLVKLSDAGAFAHLHPTRLDTLNYRAALPVLPSGQYRLYADIVYRNGFAETLTDTVQIPSLSASSSTRFSSDDSWLIGQPANAIRQLPRLDASMAPCGIPAVRVPLADGSSLVWTDKPGQTLETNQMYRLRFAVADKAGRPAPLEPYLGMTGHAVIVQTDGPVYTHLHPVGTYSMAAEASLVERIEDTVRTFYYPDPRQFRDSIDRYLVSLQALPDAERNKKLAGAMQGMSHPASGGLHSNMVEFPYQFPQPGNYRIWVQVKRNGQVLTGAFDTVVKAD